MGNRSAQALAPGPRRDHQLTPEQLQPRPSPAIPQTTKPAYAGFAQQPRLRGFLDAPKRTRTSTRLSRTRPSTWSPGCQIRPRRVRTSITSGGMDEMDASDGMDVATS